MGVWWSCAALAAGLGLVYLLYSRGFAVSKSIRAVLFLFQPGGDQDKAVVNSCSGWVEHVGLFREARIYAFTLDAQLANGDVEVTLLDRDRRQLLRLNRYYPSDSVGLEGGARYYLRWEFRNATGSCTLAWRPLQS